MKCSSCGYDNEDQAQICNLCGELILQSSTQEEAALISDAFRPPIFTTPNSTYTIGREEKNEIVLKGDLVSREHSRISTDEQGNAYVEDLGSTNGTLVNGIKIQNKIPLKLNDTVTVGSYHISYKKITPDQVEQLLSSEEEASTRTIRELGGPDGMVGNLSHLSMTEIVATLDQNEKTGVLILNYGPELSLEGRIYFARGKILRCEFSTGVNFLLNLDAIYSLLQLSEGAFEFAISEEVLNYPDEFPLTTQQILLEFARNLDEKDSPP